MIVQDTPSYQLFVLQLCLSVHSSTQPSTAAQKLSALPFSGGGCCDTVNQLIIQLDFNFSTLFTAVAVLIFCTLGVVGVGGLGTEADELEAGSEEAAGEGCECRVTK